LIFLLLLYFSKKNNRHFRKDIDYTFDPESASIKAYVDKYDDIYSLDVISQKLIDAGYNSEKVRNYINRLK